MFLGADFMLCCDTADQLTRLRVYASAKWMESSQNKANAAEDEAYFPSADGRPITNDAEFFDAFKRLMMFGTGYPVLKYGRGKIVKRNLQIDQDMAKLSWVCMRRKAKDSTEKDRSMRLADIQSVDRDAFNDTPPDSLHLCLAFRVPVQGKVDVEKVLKIICFYEVDVIVLQHGFALVHQLTQNRADSGGEASWLYRTFFKSPSSASIEDDE